MTKDEALKLALEALERCVATCFDLYAHEQAISWSEHFVNQTITAIKEALAQDTWDELTLAEVKEAYNQHAKYQEEEMGASGWVEFADALQTILRSKNT